MRYVLGMLFMLVTFSSWAADKWDPTTLTPAQMLQGIDKNYNNFNDQITHLTMYTLESGGAQRATEMKQFQLGKEKRLLQFLGGTEKGKALLVLENKEMYIYLPDYHKVRRIANHVRNQGFQGYDFNFDDLSSISYADEFHATKIGETKDDIILQLAPKNKKRALWALQKIYISKKYPVFTKMEYFNEKGVLARTQLRQQVKLIQNLWMQMKLTMTDHLKKHSTYLAMHEMKMNQNIPESYFTKRFLIRGK